jgi:hypothetical protein
MRTRSTSVLSARTRETKERTRELVEQSRDAGPDGIPALFYKHAASSLARPLCIIFNRSLLQGRVP